MRCHRAVVLIAAVGVIAACSKKAAEPDVEAVRQIAGDSAVIIDRALADAKDRIPTRDPGAGLAACAKTTPILGRLHASEHAQLALRLESICTRDLPLAELAAAADADTCAAVATVIAARAALERAGRFDDVAKQLADRFAARCPG